MEEGGIMNQLRQSMIIVLCIMFTLSSLQGQEICHQEKEEEEVCSEAYLQSSYTAHWSVYIPITLLVAAAIYFGLADQKHHDPSSSDPQDGLGCIVHSKRIGNLKYSSSYKNSSYSYSRSRAGYQH